MKTTVKAETTNISNESRFSKIKHKLIMFNMDGRLSCIDYTVAMLFKLYLSVQELCM